MLAMTKISQIAARPIRRSILPAFDQRLVETRRKDYKSLYETSIRSQDTSTRDVPYIILGVWTGVTASGRLR